MIPLLRMSTVFLSNLLKLTALMKRAKALGVFIGIFRNPDLSRCTGCRKAAKVGAIAKSFGAWLQIPIKFYRGFCARGA